MKVVGADGEDDRGEDEDDRDKGAAGEDRGEEGDVRERLPTPARGEVASAVAGGGGVETEESETEEYDSSDAMATSSIARIAM